MSFYYMEPAHREPNNRGRPRLVTVLGNLPGAQHYGFDGDGTPKGSMYRLWAFEEEVPDPFPSGVLKVTKTEFDKAIAGREAAKPVRVEPELPDPETVPFTPQERKALRALLKQSE